MGRVSLHLWIHLAWKVNLQGQRTDNRDRWSTASAAESASAHLGQDSRPLIVPAR